jgi:hypothetical protein
LVTGRSIAVPHVAEGGSRISVIPMVPPTLLHTLLLHGLRPLEQQTPVDIAIQDPLPGPRRLALG